MRFDELDGATVGVWGAGRETRSLAAQLTRRLPAARIAVVVLDDPAADAGALAAHGGAVVGSGDAVAALARCDVVVRSPGVSIHRAPLRELAARGIPITTATALWLAQTGGAGAIGVTGTKGKSTTATAIAHLARAAGRSVQLAGNIGVPALDLLDEPPADVAVIELSSYQIADLAIGPEVAVVTNLHPEHLDWHLSEDAYRADKLRLLGLPGVRAIAVNGRDATLVAHARTHAPELALFAVPEQWDVAAAGPPPAAAGPPPAAAGLPSAAAAAATSTGAGPTRDAPTAGWGLTLAGELVVAPEAMPLRGEHNALNLCAALTALTLAGVELPPLPAALDGLRPLAHRLEVVAERDGVLWVDDSISTTPESALAALASFPDRAVVLIGGGHDRGQDHDRLARELARRDAVVVGLPGTGARLVAAARAAGIAADRAFDVADMRAAVERARALATSGGVVLLSPAAPSYNAYRDFEQRGADFRACVAAGRDD